MVAGSTSRTFGRRPHNSHRVRRFEYSTQHNLQASADHLVDVEQSIREALRADGIPPTEGPDAAVLSLQGIGADNQHFAFKIQLPVFAYSCRGIQRNFDVLAALLFPAPQRKSSRISLHPTK